MINLGQVRDHWVRPTLLFLAEVEAGQYSLAAEQLVLGTLVVESRGLHLAQLGGGPARSYWQIEPATLADLYENWLPRHQALALRLARLRPAWPAGKDDQLVAAPCYACAIARQVYYRRPEPLPAPGDWPGLAGYYKAHYNTAAGASTVERSADLFEAHVAPLYQ